MTELKFHFPLPTLQNWIYKKKCFCRNIPSNSVTILKWSTLLCQTIDKNSWTVSRSQSLKCLPNPLPPSINTTNWSEVGWGSVLWITPPNWESHSPVTRNLSSIALQLLSPLDHVKTLAGARGPSTLALQSPQKSPSNYAGSIIGSWYSSLFISGRAEKCWPSKQWYYYLEYFYKWHFLHLLIYHL